MAMVTVAIVTFECNAGLRRVIQSLLRSNATLAAAGRVAYTILIVDNSPKSSAKIIFEEFAGLFLATANGHPAIKIEYLQSPQNNMGLARRLAIEHSDTEWVAFVDSDCVVGDGWLSSLMVELQLAKRQDARVCAVGGANVAPADECDFYAALSLMRKVFWGHLYTVQLQAGRARKEVDHLSTTNVLYERQAVIDVGNFSVSNKDVGEDIDLSCRLRKGGGRLLYTPHATVLHYEAATLPAWAARAFRFGQAQVNVILNNNWAHALNRRVVWPNTFMILFFLSLAAGLTVNIKFIFFAAGYLLFIIGSSLALCVASGRSRLTWLLVKLFLVSHFGYALGQTWAAIKDLQLNLHLKESNELS